MIKRHKARLIVSVPFVYSEEDNCFIGDLVGIRDIVSFHGDSLAEIREAFEESVDDYLLTCQEFNRSPQKPVCGKDAAAD